jgi:hypothetical protein
MRSPCCLCSRFCVSLSVTVCDCPSVCVSPPIFFRLLRLLRLTKLKRLPCCLSVSVSLLIFVRSLMISQYYIVASCCTLPLNCDQFTVSRANTCQFKISRTTHKTKNKEHDTLRITHVRILGTTHAVGAQ